MTKNEAAQILAVLKAAYPSYYVNQKEQDVKAVISLWQEMFANDNPQIVAAAVKAFINSDIKGFPPSIGQIRGKINLLTRPERMTEQEAWGMVAKAVSNSWYHASEEFNKLPAELQELIGSANQLREWGQMDSGTLQTVVASNFMRSYREQTKRAEEYDALPGDVTKMLPFLALDEK